MNYLAHSYLSLHDPDIQIGNLLGDFVKGNKFLLYPEKIKQGIQLHRNIDSYTDGHVLVQYAIRYFKSSYRLSGGVFVDILFDHFLANDIRYFSDETLMDFTNNVYENLSNNAHLFDPNMKQFFFYMSEYNWLYHYRHLKGLTKSIEGICKRHPVLGDSIMALKIIDEHYNELQNLYKVFFPELKKHVLKIGETI